MIQADREGRMTFVSAALMPLLGHSEQDWRSQPLSTWIHPQDQDILAAVWEHGGAIDVRVRHQEARWVWMRMQIHRTLIAAQPVWIINAQDITQQRNIRSSWQETAKQVQILVLNGLNISMIEGSSFAATDAWTTPQTLDPHCP